MVPALAAGRDRPGSMNGTVCRGGDVGVFLAVVVALVALCVAAGAAYLTYRLVKDTDA